MIIRALFFPDQLSLFFFFLSLVLNPASPAPRPDVSAYAYVYIRMYVHTVHPYIHTIINTSDSQQTASSTIDDHSKLLCNNNFLRISNTSWILTMYLNRNRDELIYLFVFLRTKQHRDQFHMNIHTSPVRLSGSFLRNSHCLFYLSIDTQTSTVYGRKRKSLNEERIIILRSCFHRSL